MSGRVSPRVLDIMSRTKGWVRFIAVLMFVNFGLTVINNIVILNSSSRSFGDSDRVGQFIGLAVMLLLYLYPAVKLNSYASRIGALLQSGRAADLDAALNEHRAFWRYVGIVVIVLISIFIVFIFFTIAVTASRARF